MIPSLEPHQNAAALFCGWGAEVHLLLKTGVGNVVAVDQLQGLMDLMRGELPEGDRERVHTAVMDAQAFLMLAPEHPGFDVITALGGGPSYVGQGALLAAMRERLAPGGVALVGDLTAIDENRRGEVSQLFGVEPAYVMNRAGYLRLVEHAGFTVTAEAQSSPQDWADYFARMESFIGMDLFPFNDTAFPPQLEKEKTVMLSENPPGTYFTWRLEKKS